ncbi:FkbM family methyltransferase [Mesorhizobium sp. B2-7-3]|uniref:FkbM family methyltransferase n=1 Tax=Mesorhizobium sp. B2-7-3 TaxID=2589907 RepID=UPI0015E4094F|nr:FkbM family methyltransferase [Mesorhizobium sp. B2-7-3]
MKVAVYTIALNEAANAERWANSAVEADYRIVADTGSTDGTVERLIAAGVTVHSIAVRPWRFDDARNAAMALIPADVDVCCTMDMDRYLEPGWRAKLEAAWTIETTALFCQTIYRSRVDDPTPLRSWPAKNFHHRWGYRFKRPVHEALVFTGEKEVSANSSDIVMFEVQDLAKPTRNSYLPLMEVAHKEDSDDAQICFWLGRDLMWANQEERAVQLLERYLALPTSTWREERSEAMRYIARMQPEGRLSWLDKARMEAPHRREIWLDLAEEFHAKADWLNLFWAATNGIEKSHRTGSYLDDTNCWGFRLFDLGAIAAWKLNSMDRAVEWGQKALDLDRANQRLKSNLSFFVQRKRQDQLGDLTRRIRSDLFSRISRRPVTLVQVGANDGTALSEPIKQHHWKGILIEPVPFIFESLKRTYEAIPDIITLNVAVHGSDDGGFQPFYAVKPLSNPPVSWYNGLSSFNKTLLLSHSSSIPDLECLIDEMLIKTRTLRGILTDLNVADVDFLMVDAEGYDGTVVRSFPFDMFRPKLIIYETRHLEMADREHTETLLQQQKYFCLHMNDGEDVYAVSEDIMSKSEARFLESVMASSEIPL